MPDILNSDGLQTATQAELYATLSAAMQQIYGADINLDSDSPDGQWLNIIIQAVLDLEDLLTQIYNGFDPDNAIGVTLDQRCAINGVVRQAGTFTITNITLVNSQSVNLYGQDQTAQPIYTISDSAGNLWELTTTQLGLAAGSHVLVFEAAIPGAQLTIPNTITIPVTIVLGVTSVNNPTTYTTLGVNEESDAALRVRRLQSVSLASQGYLAGLLAALENTPGVTAAFVYENVTNTTDGDGVPGHSIWVIVAGSATNAAIAQVIYDKRNAGAGMFGSVSYTITQVDGSLFTVYWDDVVAEPLFIKFTATSLNGTNPPNIAAIRSGLPAIYLPGVNAEVNINQLATLVQQIDPNTLVTLSGFSTTESGSYTNTLSPAVKKNQFVVSSADIIILPMILSPTTSTILHATSETFTGLGGFGAYTYSISINNSGGTINSGSGLYTAGSTSSVTDTILVTDGVGNIATATVAVT